MATKNLDGHLIFSLGLSIDQVFSWYVCLSIIELVGIDIRKYWIDSGAKKWLMVGHLVTILSTDCQPLPEHVEEQ